MAELDYFQLLSTLLYSPDLPGSLLLGTEPSANVSKCYLLPYHIDRLLSAAKAFNWDSAISYLCRPDVINHVADSIESHLTSTHHPRSPDQSYRLRLLVAQFDAVDLLSIQSTPIPTPDFSNTGNSTTIYFPQSLHPPSSHFPSPTLCTVHISPVPTRPTLFTTHKTTHRDPYTQIRTHFSLPPTTPPTQTEVLLYNPSRELTEATFSTIYLFRDGVGWVTPKAECGGNVGTTRRWALETGLCREGVVSVDDVRDGELVWLSNGVRGFWRGVVKMDRKGEMDG